MGIGIKNYQESLLFRRNDTRCRTGITQKMNNMIFDINSKREG